jgi:hypothetical protein
MDISNGYRTATDNPRFSAAAHLQRFRNRNWWHLRIAADGILCSSEYGTNITKVPRWLQYMAGCNILALSYLLQHADEVCIMWKEGSAYRQNHGMQRTQSVVYATQKCEAGSGDGHALILTTQNRNSDIFEILSYMCEYAFGRLADERKQNCWHVMHNEILWYMSTQWTIRIRKSNHQFTVNWQST